MSRCTDLNSRQAVTDWVLWRASYCRRKLGSHVTSFGAGPALNPKSLWKYYFSCVVIVMDGPSWRGQKRHHLSGGNVGFSETANLSACHDHVCTQCSIQFMNGHYFCLIIKRVTTCKRRDEFCGDKDSDPRYRPKVSSIKLHFFWSCFLAQGNKWSQSPFPPHIPIIPLG